jgi:hypothetical protein
VIASRGTPTAAGPSRPAATAPFRLHQIATNPPFSRCSRPFPSECHCREQKPREGSALSLLYLAASLRLAGRNPPFDAPHSRLDRSTSAEPKPLLRATFDRKVEKPRRKRVYSSIWRYASVELESAEAEADALLRSHIATTCRAFHRNSAVRPNSADSRRAAERSWSHPWPVPREKDLAAGAKQEPVLPLVGRHWHFTNSEANAVFSSCAPYSW